MSDTLDLARQFIAKLRAHGYKPYVDHGRFCIRPSSDEPTEQDEQHPVLAVSIPSVSTIGRSPSSCKTGLVTVN
jgi:hypothetical protein